MSVLVIGDAEMKQIEAALVRARKNTLPWSKIQGAIVDDRDDPKETLMLNERKSGYERPASEHIMLGTYRVAISFEEQPAGICRHLSISSHRRGKVPGKEVLAMVLPAFGFSIPIEHGRIWMEEFSPGWMAINVVEVVT